MKTSRRINSFICYLLVMLVITLNTGFVVYAAESEEENSFNSVVEVESYSVDGGYIEAGKESNISLTLRNANRNSEAINLMVAVRSNSGVIFPKYGEDNQFYVGNLKAGSSTTISIPIAVSSSFAGEYADFICDLVYVSGGKKITNSSIMIIPGQSFEAVVVKSLEVSAHAVKNNPSLLSINYINNGADNINDAVLLIDGNVGESTKEIELDVIAAGKSYNKDCNIIFTQAGDQTVSVMLKYTDVDGEQVQTDLGNFKVTVAEENTPTILEKEPNAYLVWGGRGISLVALVMIVISTLIYVKKR